MSATHSARLQGRRILIRGAASRIGRRTAELFAAEGALLTLLDCDRKRLAEVARETGGVAADADVTQEVSVARRRTDRPTHPALMLGKMRDLPDFAAIRCNRCRGENAKIHDEHLGATEAYVDWLIEAFEAVVRTIRV